MSHRRKIRMQNPHIAVTGSPETTAMNVNAVDDLGRKTVDVVRTANGQLCLTMGKGDMVRLPEEVFNRTVLFWYAKYGGA